MSVKSHSESGFSLTEVIVAFAVLAVSLSVLMQSFSLGGKSVRKVDRKYDAIEFGQSKMEEIGHTIELQALEISGRYEPNGFGWRMVIEPIDPVKLEVISLNDGEAILSSNLFQAHVAVYDEQSGRLLSELRTVKYRGAAQ